MATQFVLIVRDSRDANTVLSEVEPMGNALDPNAAISHNEGDAWAYCRQLAGYFASASVGSINANITVLNLGLSASATVTSSGTNVSNGDTITINGTVITFVTGTPVGSQVKIGLTAPESLQNLEAFINNGGSAGALSGVSIARSSSALVLLLIVPMPGTAGNSTTLAKSAASLTISGATYTGGVNPTNQHVISAGF